MFAIKEIHFGWFVFAGLFLAAVMMLEMGLLRGGKKQALALVLVLSSAVGVSLLLFTSVGASYPLRESMARRTNLGPGVQQGEEIYFKYGCPNCHQLYGWGTPAGPDLGGIVNKRGAAWVKDYMLNPEFRGVTSAMPDYASLRPDELSSLLDFMSAASNGGK